jgi:hypothetical protein
MNWIDCKERMPEERVLKSPIPDRPGHYPDFTASDYVLVWDLALGNRVALDFLHNGKWVNAKDWSRIVAWMPIPDMDIKEYM